MMPHAAVPADIPGILALWNRVICDTAPPFHRLAKTETMLSLMHVLQPPARAGRTRFTQVSARKSPVRGAFHAAIGFQDLATLPRVGYKFGRWIDLHLMQKFLT